MTLPPPGALHDALEEITDEEWDSGLFGPRPETSSNFGARKTVKHPGLPELCTRPSCVAFFNECEGLGHSRDSHGHDHRAKA